MPRAAGDDDEGRSALGAALRTLCAQSTADEYQHAVAFLLTKATSLAEAAAGDTVFNADVFRLPTASPNFEASLGRYAAALPCLGALGFVLDGGIEFTLPAEALDVANASHLDTLVSELQAESAPSGGPGGGTRRSVAEVLRRSFGGGGAQRSDSLDAPLLERQDSGADLSRQGSVLTRGFSGMRTTFESTLGRTNSGGSLARGNSNGSVEEEFSCPICLCNEVVSQSFTLACGHRFCRDCVAGYAAAKVNDGREQTTDPPLPVHPRPFMTDCS